MTTSEPIKEVKSIKHTFTEPERNQIGGDLARGIASKRGVETEFDQVKASYKAKISESDARIEALSTSLMNGFEFRNESCVVVFLPKERKKNFFLEADWKRWKDCDPSMPEPPSPVAVEDMTQADFQMELIQAESAFDNKEEIQLFQPVNGDSGVLVVGCLGNRWYSALRVTIGKMTLNERLDGEQRNYKVRADAVKEGVRRVNQWAKENLKEAAKGFEDSFKAVVEAHKERAE